MQIEIQTEIGSENVLAQETLLVGFCDSLRKPLRREMVFTTQEDVSRRCPDRVGPDHHSFDQLVRVLFHQDPVLEGPRFHFVCVNDEILGFGSVLPHRHETPFQPRREPGTASASKLGILNHLLNPKRVHCRDRRAQSFVSACRLVVRQGGIRPSVDDIPGQRLIRVAIPALF